MGISLSPFQPGAVNNQGGAPDALAQLLAALTQGADIGAAGARTEVQRKTDENRLKLDQKKVDLQIAKEEREMARETALGELQRILLTDVAEKGGMSQFAPQGQPMQGGGSTSAPQQQFGPTAGPPPQASWTPPNDGSRPMDRYMAKLAEVPADLVNDYLALTLPDATKAQEKYDMGIAFDEAEAALAPLLTPQQRASFKAGRNMAMGGAPKDLYEQLMPKAQIDLLDAMEKVKTAKNQREADATATPYLVFYGLAAPNEKGVIPGAAKILADYKSQLSRDAATARKAEGQENTNLLIKGLEGVALDMAMQSNQTKPKAIFERLRAMPIYNTLPDGVLLGVANAAPKKAYELSVKPDNETQLKLQMVAASGTLAYEKIEQLTSKTRKDGKPPTTLGVPAIIAAIPAFATAGGGAATGFAVGKGIAGMGGQPKVAAAAGAPAPLGSIDDFGMVGTKTTPRPPTSAKGLLRHPAAQLALPVAGALVGAGVGVVVEPLAQMAMSSDQQEMYTAGNEWLDAILRPRTGAVINAIERPVVMQTYLDMDWDSEPRKVLKRALRARMHEMIERGANLPVDELSDRLAARRAADRELLGIPEDGRIDTTTSPVDNFTFRTKRPNETWTEYGEAYEAAFGSRNRPRSAPSVQRVDPLGRPVGRPRQPD